jgi:hypothetical protein
MDYFFKTKDSGFHVNPSPKNPQLGLYKPHYVDMAKETPTSTKADSFIVVPQ